MPSLAARCTACGTVFRVVQDQLRVAGGLVRCGRCGEVFNAAESLIDLDTATATSLAALPNALPNATTTARSNATTTAPPAAEASDGPAPGTAFELHLEEFSPLAAAEAPDSAAATPSLPAGRTATPPLDFSAVEPLPEAEAEAEAAHPPDPRAEADDMPSFVRSADRAQRWRQPRVRAALLAGAVLAAVALAAQAAHTYRDQLAARLPAARPALEAACSVLACRIEAARAIDKLAVESSGLVRVEKSSVYKLQVTLRNRSDIPLALPAMDLTLSDGAGRTVARRVLRMADLGVNMTTLPAGRELALQATLQAATDPVVGYTIELFYP